MLTLTENNGFCKPDKSQGGNDVRLLFKGVLAALTMTCGLAQAAEVTIRFPVEYSLEVAPGAANRDMMCCGR